MRLIVAALTVVFAGGSIFAQTGAKLKTDDFRLNTSACRKSDGENFKVTVYEDGKLQSIKTFVKGFVTKQEIVYELDKKKITGVTRYYYTKSGKINTTEVWKNGRKVSHQDRDYDFDVDLTARYLYSADFLKKKGICLPSPGLIFSSIKDTAAIFDTADDNGDFKKQTSSNGDLKTINFVGFNKNIRFDPTLLDINADQTITDYEITLKNGYLYKEIYKTGASELKEVSSAEIIREYTYKGNRLMKFVTTSNLIGKDGKPSTSVTKLEFVYKKIKKD